MRSNGKVREHVPPTKYWSNFNAASLRTGSHRQPLSLAILGIICYNAAHPEGQSLRISRGVTYDDLR